MINLNTQENDTLCTNQEGQMWKALTGMGLTREQKAYFGVKFYF